MLLAIDPGSLRTGYALFEERGKVQELGVFCPEDGLSAPERLIQVVQFIREYIGSFEVTTVACESWGGPRNPTLQVLITAIGQMVRGLKKDWITYPPGSVLVGVKPRNMPAKTTEERKTAMRVGVLALHPYLRRKVAKCEPELMQDAIDAVAVGECHMGKEREKLLTKMVNESNSAQKRGRKKV